MRLGEKVKITLQSYELTAAWDTPFGPVFLYTFRDFMNNIFVWKTSKFIENDICQVIGRIKTIEYYNNLKEYVLTYCKVIS